MGGRRGRTGTIVAVGVLGLAAVAVMDVAPAGAQAPPTVVVPPDAAAGDQAVVSISGGGCPDRQVEVTVAFDDASATELAGDQSFPPSPLASTLGAPDGTWAVDVSMQLWGQMTIGYRCDGASGSASVTPPVDGPFAMQASALTSTTPGAARYRVSGTGCPGPVVRVGAAPSPLADFGVLGVGVDASATVQPDGSWTVDATFEPTPELAGRSASYEVFAACYQADTAGRSPVIRYANALVTLQAAPPAPTTTAPAVGVTPTFTG